MMRSAIFFASAVAVSAGTYSVTDQEVTVGGYKCKSFTQQYQTAHVYYPPLAGKTPLISWAHGFNNPGSEAWACYEEMLKALAGEGYFVIALESSSKPLECKDEAKDQLRSIDWLKSSQFASQIDFLEVGLMGHSMGGGASYHNAGVGSTVDTYNIAAAVVLHGQTDLFKESTPLVPTFYTTGTDDDVIRPRKVKSAYSDTTGVPKAFWEVTGAVHDEPMCDCGSWVSPGLQRSTPYVIAFFDCHIKGQSSQCNKIYGSGSDSLCGGLVETTDCEHENGPTSEAVTV